MLDSGFRRNDRKQDSQTFYEPIKDGGYAVLTHDLDFGAILAATSGNAPSVVQVRTQDVFPEAIGALIIAAVKQFKDEIEKGVLISVDENRSRARLLPLA